MILGNICSRTCGFCSVPQGHPAPLDPKEPYHIAEMASAMDLRYVVITSVNRDELPDGGARHFAQTVCCVRQAVPKAKIEVLTPDFCGNMAALALVLDARRVDGEEGGAALRGHGFRQHRLPGARRAK